MQAAGAALWLPQTATEAMHFQSVLCGASVRGTRQFSLALRLRLGLTMVIVLAISLRMYTLCHLPSRLEEAHVAAPVTRGRTPSLQVLA